MPILNLIALGCVGIFGYKTGKLNGFSLGLEYLRMKGISRSADGHEHFCNVTTANVVCFEREGELWVKEYSGIKEREGRTYLVFLSLLLPLVWLSDRKI